MDNPGAKWQVVSEGNQLRLTNSKPIELWSLRALKSTNLGTKKKQNIKKHQKHHLDILYSTDSSTRCDFVGFCWLFGSSTNPRRSQKKSLAKMCRNSILEKTPASLLLEYHHRSQSVQNTPNIFIWLVVDLPLWKILVSWDYYSQNMGKKCSKPPNIFLYVHTQYIWLCLKIGYPQFQ